MVFFLLDSTCSITSCSICSNSCDSESADGASSQHSEEPESVTNQPHSPDLNEYRPERSESPVRRLKKSLSAEILNHPPLPRFPRYDVKRIQRSSADTANSSYIPPLPHIDFDEKNRGDESLVGVPVTKSEISTKAATAVRKKNASMSNLTSELTFQNLSKFNYTSVDEFNNNPTPTNFNPMAYPGQQHSVIDIVPKPSKNASDIDQTLGIPLTFDTVDNTGNAFYPSLGPHYPSNNNNNDVSNDYEYHQVPTTIHQYPLISGTIPSTTQAKLNYSTLPAPTMNIKREPSVPTGSILSNPNNTNNAGGKNKVKFSDTITVAVVPEISRKEKIANFNDRMKRKPGFSNMMDPRRELAESLPLCHPNEDYLKDFSPVSDRSKDAPSTSKSNDDKKKPSIKVVHFGVV